MPQDKAEVTHKSSPEPKTAQSVVVAKSSRKTKRWLFGLSGGVVALALLFFGVGTLAIYWFNWQNGYTYIVSRVLPLPVATFNNQRIYYRDYYPLANFISTVTQVSQKSSAPKQGNGRLTADTAALNQLVQLAYLTDYAAKHNLSISSQQLNSAVNTSINNLSASLRPKYSSNLKSFKEQVLLTLLEQKVTQSFTSNPANAQAALNKAKTLKAQLGNSGLVAFYAAHSSPANLPPSPDLATASTAPPADLLKFESSLPFNILSDPFEASDGNIYLVEKVGSSGSAPKIYTMVIPADPGFNINAWLTAQMKGKPYNIYLRQLNVTTKHA